MYHPDGEFWYRGTRGCDCGGTAAPRLARESMRGIGDMGFFDRRGSKAETLKAIYCRTTHGVSLYVPHAGKNEARLYDKRGNMTI